MANEQIVCTEFETPIGKMIVGSTESGCCLVEFQDRGGVEKIRRIIEERHKQETQIGSSQENARIIEQFKEYFAGSRTEFDLPLDMVGTPFEKLIWKELLATPFGVTRSYGEIAAAVGKPQASRAVGRANGANRMSIVVPCHRIIESTGGLRGYGGGLWRKKWLLDHEKKVNSRQPTLLLES